MVSFIDENINGRASIKNFNFGNSSLCTYVSRSILCNVYSFPKPLFLRHVSNQSAQQTLVSRERLSAPSHCTSPGMLLADTGFTNPEVTEKDVLTGFDGSATFFCTKIELVSPDDMPMPPPPMLPSPGCFFSLSRPVIPCSS